MNTALPPNRPRAAPQAPRRAVRAFSLVELATVLAIIACVAGMAYPRYASSLSRYRVDLAAKRFAADLALAQAAARASGSFQTVAIDAAGATYRLNEQSSLTATGGRYLVSLSASPFFTTIASAKTSGGAAVTALKFDGYGRPDQALTARLASGDHTRTITVDASTGAINVTTP